LSEAHRGERVWVVCLLQDLKFGGTQRQAIDLARGLNPKRYRVELWVLMGGDDLLPEAEEYGLTIVRLGRGAYVWPSALLRLWRRLRSHPVDILLLLTGIPNIWGRIFGRLSRVPVIVGACRDHVLWHERFLGGLAHHHVCNSLAVREYAANTYGLDRRRMSVIPNGLDPSRLAHPDVGAIEERTVVLNVGRLVGDKDQVTLISAFSMIAGAMPGLELWIVGDGPLERRLKRIAQQTPCPDRIRLVPGQRSIGALFHRARIFVLSSRRESFPNVVLEAMSFGLPVVATDVGGLSEIVEHERTGLLVTPCSPAALAKALKQLLDDAQMRRALGQAGQARVREVFSLPQMVRRHEALFDELLDRGRRRPEGGP
jgi:glycosyltransferase involved in cell wall biosynthesis